MFRSHEEMLDILLGELEYFQGRELLKGALFFSDALHLVLHLQGCWGQDNDIVGPDKPDGPSPEV
jgi:hypothetical protein